jgi:protein O-mannosyl-transferase
MNGGKGQMNHGNCIHKKDRAGFIQIPVRFNILFLNLHSEKEMALSEGKSGHRSATSPVKPGSTDHHGVDTKWLGKGFPLLWFAIVAFILFGQSVNFNYTYLDDQSLILNNLDRLKSPAFLSNAFTEDVFHSPPGQVFYYRPILTLTFMADAIAGKGSFSMFHVSNILYHILATFLLFLFFVELGYDRVRSFLFCMVFLAHPLVTQAVAWVPGRNDTLLAIFILASFLFWLMYLKTGSNMKLVLHLFFYILALFTKENAIVLPFLIIFYSVFILRAPLKKLAPAGVGWIVITGTWAIIRAQVLEGRNEAAFADQLMSLIKNMPALLSYLGKAFFPYDLSVYPILADMMVSVALGIVAIALLTFLLWKTTPKRWALYFFALAWFLAFLVPAFLSVNNQISNFSEHRSYIALAGILLIVMELYPVKNSNFTRIVPVSVVAGICLLFGTLTFIHTRYFKDQFTFWENAVETSPTHAFNFNNLGAMYFLKGDLVKAEPLFRKALSINPYEPMANSNTGLICMNTNRPAEAEKFYLQEIRINPTYDHAYFNLGILYYNHGRYDEGIRLWEKTLTVNPRYLDAYKALQFAFQKLNRKEDYDRITLLARQNGVMP